MDIVLVNPHYGGNAGRVLRLCKNFNIVDKLVLVNPLFDLNDLDFIKGCASAKKYINDLIRIENDLSFLKDYSLIIGTSCKYKEKYYSKANIDLESFVKKFSNKGFPKKTSILFGREPSGLTREELKLCDMILYIPTSTEYPSLNLSMAVGIVLYRLFVSTKWRREKNISKEKIKKLTKENNWISNFIKTHNSTELPFDTTDTLDPKKTISVLQQEGIILNEPKE